MALFAHLQAVLISAGGASPSTITCTDERTGKQFHPKVLIAFSVNRSNLDTAAETDMSWGYGAAVSPSNRRFTASYSQHGVPDSNAGGGGANNLLLRFLNSDSAFSSGTLDVSSFDANGYTLNAASFTSVRRIVILALGGDIQCTLTDLDAPGVTGNLDVDLGMDLATGKDDKALIIFGYSSSGGAVGSVRTWNDRHEISVVAGNTISQWAIGQSAVDGAADSNTSRYMRFDEALCWANVDSANQHASVTQWNSNGARFNFTESGSADYHWFVVAIKGQNWRAGSGQTRTDSSETRCETGCEPGFLLVASHQTSESSVDTTQAESKGSTGVALSASNRFCISFCDADNLPDTDISQGLHTDRIYNEFDHTNADKSTIAAAMDLVSFDGRGFTVVMDDPAPSTSAFGWLVGADEPSGYRDLRISGRNYLSF